MEFWKVLKVSETTDQNDLRSMCANKLKGPYVVLWGKYQQEVAVLLDRDIDLVKSAFDVIDRRLVRSVFQGATSVMAFEAWNDYNKKNAK